MTKDLLSADRPVHAATLIVLVLAMTIATIEATVRVPFGEPGGSTFIKACLLVIATVLSAHACALHAASGDKRAETGLALVMPASILVAFLAGSSPLVGSMITILLALGCGVGLWRFVDNLRRLTFAEIGAAFAIGVALGVVYFFVVNGTGYAQVITPELASVGLQFHDTLYHAAIAAMIANYGAASTGIDGLVPLTYHVFSHAWIGYLSNWLAVPTLHAYYLVPHIVGLPLLLLSLFFGTYFLWRPAGPVRISPFAVVVLPMALLWLIDHKDWAAYLMSESYMLSLILFLFALPLLMKVSAETMAAITFGDIAILLLLTVMIAVTKISVGAVFGAGVAWALLRRFGLGIWQLMAIGLSLGVAGASAMAFAVPLPEDFWSIIDPLHYARTWPGGFYGNLIAIIALCAAAAWIFASGKQHRPRAAEVACIMALASLLPALLLNVDAGAMYYFINIGSWIAIVFITGTLLLPGVQHVRFGWLQVAVAISVMCVLFMMASAKRRSIVKFDNAIEALAEKVGLPKSPTPLPLVENVTRLKGIANLAPTTIGGRLRGAIAAAQIGSRRDILIFIPAQQSEFWNMSPVCQPFIVPGLFGIPMINGVPSVESTCLLRPPIGYSSYGPESRASAIVATDLCQRARRLGFAAVFAMETLDKGSVRKCS